MTPFIHLHVHSQYSLLDGASHIADLVNKAIDNGMRGMALTDHGNMYGIKELHDYCNKINKGKADDEKFKPIFGCEAYVANNTMDDKSDKNDRGRHLILLAKNFNGYKNLIKIVSKAWTQGLYYHPRTDHDTLKRYHEDIICCSACLGGEVPQLIMAGQIEKAREAVKWFKGVFGDDYYLELQRHKATVPNANHETYEKQQMVNKVLLEFSKELGVKVICTNDSHFTNEDDADMHERLVCLNTGRKISDIETPAEATIDGKPKSRMAYTKQEWFKTQEEMNEVFADVPEALANTQEILNKVEIYSIDHKPILPDFPLPEGFTNEDEYLRYLTYEGAKKRWKELDEEHKERLEFELETIKTMGFPGYFLIVQDYIKAAPKLGCSVGPGRGSAAGSAVAYCLGITNIDPLKYDLLFERFLNPDRISLPDIDVDFDDDGRGKVLQYVTQKYGAEKVAHIVTYGTMAAKMAIKDMARVENLTVAESNRLANFIPSRPNDMPNKKSISIKNCLEAFPKFREELDNPDPRVGETIRYAAALEGTVRGTGVHACGVIIGRDDITDWVPVSTADDKETGGRVVVTQYEGSVIESTGLIKMDFLGLKNLSIIKDALENIKLTHGIEIDIENIPIDDKKTYQLYCEGRTSGTFQFESAGMQKYLIELQPSCFEDLIAMNALYRPGPMDYIPSFIRRKKGEEKITYDLPCMEKYLKETYGITVYQEQVMLLSREIADFTRGQSDTLRKAMGKKQIEKMNHLEGLFYEGGEKKGYEHETLHKIWEDWKKFASYAFNKSHATCYSWVAYQTAYLKANYPSEYMAAVLSSNLNAVDKLSLYMDDCRASGIEVLGPNVNESYKSFSANKKGQIRFGLAGVKGVGGNAVDAIVKERDANGPFKDIFDFVERVDLSACNKKAVESMALAGAFGDFKEIHREDFFVKNSRDETFLDILVNFGQRYQRSKADAQNSLFGGMDDVEIATPSIPTGEHWSDIERLNKERELVGMYLSAHPLDPYFIEVNYGCNTRLATAKDKSFRLNETLTMAGVVVDYQERTGKNNKQFGILKFEDYTGSFEVTLFGELYLEFSKFGKPGTFIYVTGSYQKSMYNDTIRFNVSKIQLLDQLKGRLTHNIRITIPSDEVNRLDFLHEHIGTSQENRCELFFSLQDPSKDQQVTLRSQDQISVTRKLIHELEEMQIHFEINADV